MSIFQGRATGASRQRLDLQICRQALAVLADPAHGIQLQAAPYWAHATFAAADLDGAERWLGQQQGAMAIYYALNPVEPNLARKVLVGDVLSRRWLFVDVDRAKGEDDRDLSATDAEHEAARALAVDISDWLIGQGWPCPAIIDSGNGYHLLYRIELPNDDLSRVIIKTALHALADKFDGACGTVGKECHDARRIAKLPGTTACKGANTPDRPWRQCELLYVPENLRLLTAEMIRETFEPEVSPAQPPRPLPSPLVGRAFSCAGNREAYGKAALDRECAHVALAPPGQRNNTLNTAAFCLWQLVAAGVLDDQLVWDRLYFAARRAGLDDREVNATLRSGKAAGLQEPRALPERNGTAASSADPALSHPQELAPPPDRRKAGPEIHTLPAILRMELPEPRWAVPGILSEGLTLLAGKPKLGKSFMALNLAITIAAGGVALGEHRVLPGDVLYLCLEDRLRRIKARASKMLAHIGCQASERLHIAVEWPRQGMGGLDQIDKWLRKAEQPRLVIVDVWQKFRAALKTGGSQYEQDYNHATALKSLGDSYATSMLALHHCKKVKAEDVIDEISGTLGLAGAADGLMVLTRSRNESEAEMFITGRDVGDRKVALEFNKETFVWTLTGEAGERSDGRIKSALIDVFRANAGVIMGQAELAAAIELPIERHGSLRTILYRMTQEDMVQKVSPGRYRWPIMAAGEM